TRRPGAEVRRWLDGLGFSELPTYRLDGVEVAAEDVRLLSRRLDGSAPFLDPGEGVKRSHLRRAAKTLRRPEAELAERLAEFGVRPSGLAGLPGLPGQTAGSGGLSRKALFSRLGLTGDRRRRVRPRHRQLMSRDGDGRAPWLNPAETVPAWSVATLALSQRRSLDEVIEEYHWLGYEVEDPRTVPRAPTPGTERPPR
ncbi:MAG: hypothetical protein JWR01_192, partial [Subtercola sp.]|nr:hypothetical protein [Subtercola sp.]